MERILVVDGDGHSRLMMEVSLKGAGVLVRTAADAAEARQLLSAERFDLMLLEVELPGEGGFAFVKSLQAHAEAAELPFIFVTRRQSVPDKIAGLELGAEDYLVKPIYLREFVTRVLGYFKKQEAVSLARGGLREKYRGRLSENLSLDILKAALHARRHGRLALERRGCAGEIVFSGGRLADARAGDRTGFAAARRLLLWEDGTFEIHFESEDLSGPLAEATDEVFAAAMRLKGRYSDLTAAQPLLAGVELADIVRLKDAEREVPGPVQAILGLFDEARIVLTEAPVLTAEAIGRLKEILSEPVAEERAAPDAAPALPPEVPPRAAGPADREAPAPAAAPLPGRRVTASALAIPGHEDLTEEPELVPPPPAPAPAAPPAPTAPPPARPAPAGEPLPAPPFEAKTVGMPVKPPRPPVEKPAPAAPKPAPRPVERPAAPKPVTRAAREDFTDLEDEEAHPDIRRRKTLGLALAAGGLLLLAFLAWFIWSNQKSHAPAEAQKEKTPVAGELAPPAGRPAPPPRAEPPPPAPPPVEAVPVQPPPPAEEIKPPAPKEQEEKAAPVPPAREARPPAAEKGEAAPGGGYGDLIKKANKLLASWQLDEAEALFKKAEADDPKKMDAALGLGRVALERGQMEEAAKYFTTATGRAPRSAKAWLMLGNAAELLGRVPEAKRAYRKYLELSPKSPEAEEVRRFLKEGGQ